MERLLKDAGKIAGKKYDLSNLADVYEAIHVIQTELGITGTTAKEAEGTISGSVNMMKAAWKNLLTAFGDPNANLSEKVDAFTKSVGTVVKNVFPVFKRVVKSVWDSLGSFGNSIGDLIFGSNEAGEVNWPTWDDVKDGALKAWNYIKEKAKNLGGLVFGRKEDGSVDWPDWSDVSEKATKAWGKIKEKARYLAGLVFGRQEDGSVAWPTWEDVKSKAIDIWGKIKDGAKALGGLVFGTKEDGSVDWPTWDDVKDGAIKAWNYIKEKAMNLGGLVFGRKEDGSVDWPDWSDVSEKAKKAWGKIKEKAKYLAGLVFGRREDGSVDWPTWEDVRSKANEIWEKIKDGAKALGGLVFGTKEDGTVDWPTWETVKTKANEAWNTIVEGVKTLGGLAFGTKEDGTVNWPTWKEVGQKANEAWNSIKEEAAKLTGLVFGDESAVGNFTSKLETLKNKWSELKETVSNNAIDFLSGLTGEDPEKVVSVLKGISDAVMSLGVGIGVFQIGTKLTGIVTAVQTLLSSGLSVSHPVLLAISALAAAGTLIYQNWDGISEFFQNLWSGISQWASDAYKTVEKWWKEDIVKPIKEKWDEIVQKVQGVVADVQSAWNVIVEWFTNTIITPISNAWDGVLTGVNNAIGAVKKAWEGIVEWFEENVIGPIRSLWEGVAGMFGGSATANQPKGGRGAYSGEYGYYSGSGANPRTGTTALMNAKGNWDVPYDDFLARLHRGEMVLTASQARRYRDGEEGSSFNMDALVSSIVSAIQTGMQGVTVNSYLSGRSITDDVNRQTVRQLKARRFAT